MKTAQNQCLNRIVDIREIPQLIPSPHVKCLSLEQEANPHSKESLAGILYTHTGTVGIGEADRTSSQSINAMVERVVRFADHFVNTVDVDRPKHVLLVYRKIIRSSVYLSC